MTLEQLRIFVAVAECEHVTRGAQQLNLTQSATSAAIAALEERYATKLFDRIGRRIALTEAGRLFLKEAKAVLARASDAAKVLTDLADLTQGSLALAASQTVANYWLPVAIQSYRLRYPGVIVSTTIGNSENVAVMVREGSADLGLVEAAIDDPTLVMAPVAEDELILVAPLNHPWAARTPRSAQELKRGPWVLREPGSGTRSVFEGALPGLGLTSKDLNVALVLPSNEAVRAAAEAGAGVTVISRLVVANSVKAGNLVPVKFPLLHRRFVALRHKERYVSRAEQAFLDVISNDAASNRKTKKGSERSFPLPTIER
ncbi:LysR family transcriptional regulator [Bradyrhizobium sp. UFLA05-109]